MTSLRTIRPSQTSATLDALKDLGFTNGQWSGVTMAFSDIKMPPDRKQIIAQYDKLTDKVNQQC